MKMLIISAILFSFLLSSCAQVQTPVPLWPGGGYAHLAPHEGNDYALWLMGLNDKPPFAHPHPWAGDCLFWLKAQGFVK